MRGFNIISLFVILAINVTGCSFRSDLEGAEQSVDSLVPVEFALPDTKGMIEGLDGLVDNSSVFGMFAIDKSLFEDPEGDLTASDGMNLRNALCRYVAPSGTEPASLKFGYASENKVLYYPMSSDVSYNFYTYHKWTSDVSTVDGDESEGQTVSTMVTSKRRISVVMDVASVYDVLYSESVAPYAEDTAGEVIEGYNAAFVKETGIVPTFTMKHPASAVRLSVVVDPESKMTLTKRDRFRLNSISFTNASNALPVKASLCIVDLDAPENNGQFVEALQTVPSRAWKDADNSTGNLNVELLHDVDGDGVTTVVSEPIKVGGEHFIMPQEEPLVITMTFQHQRVNDAGGIVGNWPAITKSVTLDPKDFGVEGGYQAGQIYCYKLLVKYTNATNDPYQDSVEIKVEADK